LRTHREARAADTRPTHDDASGPVPTRCSHLCRGSPGSRRGRQMPCRFGRPQLTVAAATRRTSP
jgi:hypothetical protein